jgi:hypothetical protein
VCWLFNKWVILICVAPCIFVIITFITNKCILFYFLGHFIGLLTCFDPYGSSSEHLIHWTLLGCYIYYIIHISSFNGLWLSQIKSVLCVQSVCYYRCWNIILVSCVRLGWYVVHLLY